MGDTLSHIGSGPHGFPCPLPRREASLECGDSSPLSNRGESYIRLCIASRTGKLPAAATVQALSATGETVGKLQPTPLPDGKAVLHPDNFFKGGVMAYELLIR